MNTSELNQLLAGMAKISESQIENFDFSVQNLSLLKLRDILIGLGRIDFEDIERQVYVVRIYGGLFKKNPATAALHLTKDTLVVAIHANEGLINQHTCEGVKNELKNAIHNYLQLA